MHCKIYYYSFVLFFFTLQHYEVYLLMRVGKYKRNLKQLEAFYVYTQSIKHTISHQKLQNVRGPQD